MESVENLKKEILRQKEIIESKSGVVSVGGLNPSPAEITDGIKSIPAINLSLANATENDVILGKTFYAGTSELKTGRATFDVDIVHALVDYFPSTCSYDKEFYLEFQPGMETIRRYLFFKNNNKVHVTFNEDVRTIDDYAFSQVKNFVFENFHELTNLRTLGHYAFEHSEQQGIEIGILPQSITSIGANCFYNCVQDNTNFIFPPITYMGVNAYMAIRRTPVGTLDISRIALTALPGYVFYSLAFNCDLVIPSIVTNIGTYLNYNGDFKNIIIHSGVTTIGGNAFNASSGYSLDSFHLRTVTFQGETPPNSIGTYLFATQHIENGFKIYVPDQSVEAYKAVANLSRYANCIFPMSQKE